MSAESMLAYVLERLPKPGEAHYTEKLDRIANGADVPIHTLLKIAKGETQDPRVSTVQSLHDYFRAAGGASA